jgi:hypothetical protein
MREIRSYESVGVSAGNRRHYPAITKGGIGTTDYGTADNGHFKMLKS